MALALGGPRLKWDCLTLARNNALSWLPTRPISHILTLTLVWTVQAGFFGSMTWILDFGQQALDDDPWTWTSTLILN